MKMDTMTQKMAEAGSGQPELRGQTMPPPHQGDRFRCDVCGMEITVTSACQCQEDHSHFHCCGQLMAPV